MEVNFHWLVLGSLGVWRVTYLLTAESGPWDVFERLRQLSRSGFWGSQIDPRDRAAVAAIPMLKRVGVIAPFGR
jgi:hypothetical protein